MASAKSHYRAIICAYPGSVHKFADFFHIFQQIRLQAPDQARLADLAQVKGIRARETK